VPGVPIRMASPPCASWTYRHMTAAATTRSATPKWPCSSARPVPLRLVLGMFTANSMNCLAEALGLALPGNGTLLATTRAAGICLKTAGRRIVEMAKQHYQQGNRDVLPRSIATLQAFENAMAARHRHGRLDQHRVAYPGGGGSGGREFHHG